MSRKRTPDEQPAEASTAVAEPPAAANDNAPAADDNKPSFAERVGQRQRVSAADDNKPSFAERVGQRQRVSAADPYGIAGDYLAGVRLFESKRDRQMALKFEEKPSQAVIDKLKDAGYRWNPVDKIWAHPVRADSAMSTRIEAERVYQEVRQMIRVEKGIETSQEVPF
jgi:hypothetical protein